MTYESQAAKSGRRPVAVVRLYLPTCNLTYASAPCTAELGVTGATRCYNTKKTCQDRPNFTYSQDAIEGATNFIAFSSERLDGVRGAYFDGGSVACIPSVIEVSGSPTRLQPGEALSERANVSISIQDCFLSDGKFDKYADTRGHGGTLWQRLIARYYSFSGFKIEVETGYLTDAGAYDAANMTMRTYFVDRTSGPDSNGRISIRAKDPLNKTRRDKAECPAVSYGRVAVEVPALARPGGLQVWDITGTQPDGTDAIQQYADALAAGDAVIAVADEIAQVTAVDTGAGTITVNRIGGTAGMGYPGGFQGAEFPVVEVGTRVQLCHVFRNKRIDEVVRELVEDFAGIPEGANGFFDFSEWQAEANIWHTAYTLNAIIPEPTPVTDLLSEIAEVGAQIWWQDRTFTDSPSRIRYKAFTPAVASGQSIGDDAEIIANSVKIAEDAKRRVSQCRLWYGHYYPTLDVTDPGSFSRIEVTADLDSEQADEFGSEAIKNIYSRWLPAGTSAASEITGRYVSLYRNGPKLVSFALDAKDSLVWTGDDVSVTTRQITGNDGLPITQNMQIIEARESNIRDGAFQYVAEVFQSVRAGRYGLIGPNTLLDYTAESSANTSTYAFIADNSETMSNGDPAYAIA